MNTIPLCTPISPLADCHPTGARCQTVAGLGLLELLKLCQACPAGLRRSGGIKEIPSVIIGPSLSVYHMTNRIKPESDR